MKTVRLLIIGLATSAAAVPLMAQTGGPAPATEPLRLAQAETVSISGIQQMLKELGYEPGPVDGVMGPSTRSAIMAYQRSHDLPVTGEADSELYRRMYQTYTETTATEATASGSGAATEPAEAALSEGQRQTVVEVQSVLRRLGYDVPAVTGELDDATREAIRDYKRDVGLAGDSEIDRPLLDSLEASVATGMDDTAGRDVIREIQIALNNRGYDAGAATGTLTSQTRTAIRTYQADQGMRVTGQPSAELLAELGPATSPTAGAAELATAIQSELRARGYFDGRVDGEVGPATSAAIRTFQRDAGLPVTGEPSRELLAAIRASDVTRRAAERQQIVAEIQQELAARGYSVGEPDGEMGPETAAAIRAFQRDAGLPVTGQASRELLTQIRGSQVTAAPATPEEAFQTIFEGTTRRLLESIERQPQQ